MTESLKKKLKENYKIVKKASDKGDVEHVLFLLGLIIYEQTISWE